MTVPGGTMMQVRAFCDDLGDRVLGGGDLSSALGVVVGSHPVNVAGTTRAHWNVVVDNRGSSNPVAVQAYVVCLNG
jgi:hypothetical protein